MVCINKHDQTLSKNFSVENKIDQQSSTIFAIFNLEKAETATYKIFNKCSSVELECYQKDYPLHTLHLNPGQTKMFAWTNSQAAPLLVCKARKTDSLGEGRSKEVALDELDFTSVLRLGRSNSDNDSIVMRVNTRNGITKTLTVSQQTRQQVRLMRVQSEDEEDDTMQVGLNEENKGQEDLEQKKHGQVIFKVKIDEVGVSFICRAVQGKLREFAYAYVKGLTFVSVDKDNTRTLQLHLWYMQVDNNAGSIFPTILWPKVLPEAFKSKEAKKKQTEPSEEKALLNFLVQIKKSEPENRVIYFKHVAWLLQTLILQVDDEFISYLLRFFDEISNVVDTSLTQVHPAF